MTFDDLPLAAALKDSLRARKLVQPTPVQRDAIPPALQSKDVLACAQTGSGKTAAFVLPILQRLIEDPGAAPERAMRNLVLVPTRELAVQVAEVFGQLGASEGIMVQCVYGGVSQRRQVHGLSAGPEVVVATPGRLLDLMAQRHVDLSQVECLVLDEVDRMLDMGFVRDVRKIVAALPAKRQNLAFSATLAPGVENILAQFMVNPVRVMTDRVSTTASEVDHRICRVRSSQKLDLLQHLLQLHAGSNGEIKTLVFTATKHGADRLAKKLNGLNIGATAIHGNKSQNARERALNQFRKDPGGTLVATDVAARGLDVKGIDLVINYDLPKEGDSYVHRVGRTARAGATGRAYSFVSEGDDSLLRGIERFIRQQIPLVNDHPFPCGKLEAAAPSPSRQPRSRQAGPARGPSTSGQPRQNTRNFSRRKPSAGRPATATATSGTRSAPANGTQTDTPRSSSRSFSLSGWWRR